MCPGDITPTVARYGGPGRRLLSVDDVGVLMTFTAGSASKSLSHGKMEDYMNLRYPSRIKWIKVTMGKPLHGPVIQFASSHRQLGPRPICHWKSARRICREGFHRWPIRCNRRAHALSTNVDKAASRTRSIRCLVDIQKYLPEFQRTLLTTRPDPGTCRAEKESTRRTAAVRCILTEQLKVCSCSFTSFHKLV